MYIISLLQLGRVEKGRENLRFSDLKFFLQTSNGYITEEINTHVFEGDDVFPLPMGYELKFFESHLTMNTVTHENPWECTMRSNSITY